MPSRNQSGKPEHLFQNPNRKRKKSGKKHQNTVKWYVSLLKREEKEGSTNWIIKTKQMAEKRMKRYGITQQMIAAAMSK
ncbi:MAG: hypothetical protein H6765_03645 [Candidatus Peribacteria bacterium]|nr:MAG: hypothetical protein H6765_03645 [Candidatus Peribacteria bacterium]